MYLSLSTFYYYLCSFNDLMNAFTSSLFEMLKPHLLVAQCSHWPAGGRRVYAPLLGFGFASNFD